MGFIIKRKREFMKKILCVDDSPTITNILENIIVEAFGEEEVLVTRLSDSTLAEGELTAGMFDMLITDINMPRLNGYDLVEAARGHFSPRELKIIVISTEGQKASIVKMLKLGADAYITKPFKKPDVIGKINEFLFNGEGAEVSKEDRFVNFIKNQGVAFIEQKQRKGGIDETGRLLVSDFISRLESEMLVDEHFSKIFK